LSNAFVAKLDSRGNLVYVTYLGGSGGDSAHGIAVDARGSAYVVGTTASTNFPLAQPLQAVAAGGGASNEAFVTKLDPMGSSLVYSTYLGGSDWDMGRAIAVDRKGTESSQRSRRLCRTQGQGMILVLSRKRRSVRISLS